MEPYYADEAVTLHCGDSLDILPTLPDASVDAVVTDPPYGLGFMGKEWDSGKSFVERKPAKRNTFDHVGGNHNPANSADAARTRRVESVKFGQWCSQWASECLRVLKPGGHLVAFGAPRTYHRLAVAIEDAGFEIRDSLHWIYGQGFPKSLDVAKAIDQAGGSSPTEQARVLREARQRAGMSRTDVAAAVGCTPASVRDWEEGRARTAGGVVEYIVPSPQYRDALAALLGYSSDERRIVGASADRRGDGTVIGLGHSGVEYSAAATTAARDWSGWGTALKPAHEPIILARKPLGGTVAANVLLHGTGGINVDACRTEAGQDDREKCASVFDLSSNRNGDAYGEWTGAREDSAHPAGRWPTNILLTHAANCAEQCAPDCPVAETDRQSGTTRSRIGKPRGAAPGEGWGMTRTGAEYGDEGGASRFFPVFRYKAKAGRAERPRAGEIAHPTVKPLELMRWLVRLVTPPGGVVLEPFAGSGTTLEAAVIEGFRAIGVEREPAYAELCRTRLTKPITPVLFGDIA